MNPANGSVPATGIEVRIDRATTLPGRVWCAERPRALVAILHGLGEHSGRYAALASDIVMRARCTVVALDLPGHGDAPGPRGDFPSWPLVRDRVIPAMFTATRGLPDQPFDLPHVLLGHSMGGVLALEYALAHQRDLLALVLSAPALRIPRPAWWKLAVADVLRVAWPGAAMASGLDVSAITRDPEALQRYRDDPRVHDRITPRLYFAFREAAEHGLREAKKLALPTLLLQGMSDRLADPRGALELAGAANHGIIRFVTLADRYHEVFNDLGRDGVVKDLAAWLDAAIVV